MGFPKNDRKKIPNAWKCYKWIANGENTLNPDILVPVRASKTSIFKSWLQIPGFLAMTKH